MVLEQTAVLISEIITFFFQKTYLQEVLCVLEDVELRGAVSPVRGVALGRHPAVDQHDLHQDTLLAEVPQALNVVTNIAA